MNTASLISKLVSPPKQSVKNFILDDNLLRLLKDQCKQDEQSVLEAFHYLSIDLGKKSGSIRLRALLVVDILFQRSKIFRKVVADNMKVIVNSAGLLSSIYSTSVDHCLLNYKVEVENKVLELIQSWDLQYGKRYPQIHTVLRFLTETLHRKMPNIQEVARSTAESAQQKKEQEDNVTVLMASKLVRNELMDAKRQVSSILQRLGDLFAILFPSVLLSSEDVAPAATTIKAAADEEDDCDDVDWIDAEGEGESWLGGAAEGRSGDGYDALTTGGVPYTLEITLATTAQDIASADNELLIESVRELSRQLVRHVVPRLNLWRDTLAAALAIVTEREAKLVASNLHSESAELGGCTESTTSVLGKRAVRALDSSSLHSPVSSAAVISARELSASLAEVSGLLEAVRDVLVKKCRELLRTD